MSIENEAPIHVFIIDPHRTILWGLERLIESSNGTMEVAGSATSLVEALCRVQEVEPDVILVSAIWTESKLFDGIPALGETSCARILVLIPKRDAALQERAVVAGAHGVVDSEGAPEQILHAITKISEGEVWLNRACVTRLLHSARRSLRVADPEQRKIATLTARERQLVAAFATHPGATAKSIAELLNISAHTARNHLNAVYEKLQVANRVELYDYAHRHRLFEPAEMMH